MHHDKKILQQSPLHNLRHLSLQFLLAQFLLPVEQHRLQ